MQDKQGKNVLAFKVLIKYNVNFYVALVLTSFNFYMFVLFFAAERLKFGFIFFFLSVLSINEKKSYRPNVLLFDEYYTELYQYEKAITWILSADTIIFMGTSNSVGFTSGALQIGVSKNKKVIVVDPNPSPSFIHSEVDLIKMTASDFCKMYF